VIHITRRVEKKRNCMESRNDKRIREVALYGDSPEKST
jgi:hypothetical protein